MKSLTNLQLLNIYKYINMSVSDENSKKQIFPIMDIVKKFNTKSKWAFRLNLKKIENILTVYEEALKELQSEYLDDEHSEEVSSKNENEECTTTRVIKNEYLADYQQKCRELLEQQNDLDFKLINIEDIEDIDLEFEDLEMLSFMINEE